MGALRRVSISGVALILLGLLAGPVGAFYVDYSYYCLAGGSDGIALQDAAILEGETYAFGDYTHTGDSGNYGTVRYCADIATATVSAYALSHGVQTGPYTFPWASARVNRIGFLEELTLTVPSGDYPEGVAVGIACRVYGVFRAELGAGARGRCNVELGTASFNTDLLEVGVDEEGEIWVDSFFTLVQEIVAPGTTLTQARDYEVDLSVYFRSGRTWATQYQYQIGDGCIDFEQGLRITALILPPGVTWVSGSGVFPDLTSVAAASPDITAVPRLLPNHPNPFNPMTRIGFELPRPAAVTLSIHDTTGRRVRLLLDGEPCPAGPGELPWLGQDDHGRLVAAGVYLCRFEAEGRVLTEKLSLLK